MAPHQHPLLARLPLAAGALRLRALAASDLNEFLAYRSDPVVARYQGWQAMDRAAAAAFLVDAAPCLWQVGTWAQIGIASAHHDQLVGDIGLLREATNQAQLGFSLARSAQGQGWATAALRACIEDLLLPLGITRLRAISDARNLPSLRLLQRLGFVETGREDLLFRGEACTEISFERCA